MSALSFVEKTMRFGIGLLLLCLAGAATAQHAQPYAGEHKREIKALSDQEVKQYLSGAGMGYARAAELNGYPGPMHVLELASELKLSPEQGDRMKRLMDQHKSEARAIGARLVEAERTLDLLFRSGKAEPKALADSVLNVAHLQGEYRLSHLQTHVRTKELLSDEQVAIYMKSRGYANERSHKHH